MNERIKELAEQAAKKHGHTIRFTEEITETLDSFAELIIRECADFLKDKMDDHFAAEQLEEHFGVEE
jgi:predicted DNA-binding protein